MLNLLKVAITGGLSCGKSTVCQLFQQLGASVVSADEIVHRLLIPDSPIGKKIIELLGESIIVDKEFDRRKIAEIVFHSTDKLSKLEALLHPEVKHEIERIYEEEKREGKAPIFVAEIPLLFESSMDKDFDYTITVSCDPNIAQKRFHGPLEAYNIRSAHQMSLEEKINKSSFTIYNNGSLEELKLDVQNLYNQLKSHEF